MKISDALLADSIRLRQVYGTRTEKQTAETVAGLLDAGQLLKGRVVTIDAAGMLTVETDLGSFKATAMGSLAVGQEFLFQVVEGGSTPLLAAAGKANAVMNLLRVMLPGMFSEVMGTAGSGVISEEAVRTFWDDLAMDGQPDPVRLAKAMSRFSQSQAQNGKPVLPFPAGPGGVESTAVQKLINLVEAHVLVNQEGGGSSGSNYLIFPVFFAAQAGKGEWLYSFDQRHGGEDCADGAITNLSFYLAMSRLGDIHISLTTRAQAVSGVITVASEDAAEHVRLHLQSLVQALEKMTGATSAITCQSGAVDCLKALKDDLTSRLGVAELYALVDIRA